MSCRVESLRDMTRHNTESTFEKPALPTYSAGLELRQRLQSGGLLVPSQPRVEIHRQLDRRVPHAGLGNGRVGATTGKIVTCPHGLYQVLC